jgi:hypothetical protein
VGKATLSGEYTKPKQMRITMEYEVWTLASYPSADEDNSYGINGWHKCDCPIQIESSDDIIHALMENDYLSKKDLIFNLVEVQLWAEDRYRVFDSASGEPLYDLVLLEESCALSK